MVRPFLVRIAAVIMRCVSRYRSISINQNAFSLALRATAAKRRHSSARRRKCSMLTLSSPD
jgi:hypothetical protein